MIKVSPSEQVIADKIKVIKDGAGTHSPSIFTIAEQIPELEVKIDACFLSNPYATDLFLEFLEKELIDTNKLRDVLEFYPSQNRVIAEFIGKSIQVDPKNIFVGNGAIEIIQGVLHRFVKGKLLVNIPTFSSYYEFANAETEVVYHRLLKENDFKLDVDEYLAFVEKEKPQSVVIINPNNPDGGYIPFTDLKKLLEGLSHLENIILDESFIHFAYESSAFEMVSAAELFDDFDNLIIVKSMSKDFGIAGIRAGYAIMSSDKVDDLLNNGFLWNNSGLAEYFFRLYSRKDFFTRYEIVRKKYIAETLLFIGELEQIENIKVYRSRANFVLIELLDGSTAEDFVSMLLIRYGIYTRVGTDKIGLEGQFIRVAARKHEENLLIVEAIRSLMSSEND